MSMKLVLILNLVAIAIAAVLRTVSKRFFAKRRIRQLASDAARRTRAVELAGDQTAHVMLAIEELRMSVEYHYETFLSLILFAAASYSPASIWLRTVFFVLAVLILISSVGQVVRSHKATRLLKDVEYVRAEGSGRSSGWA